jgi:hypothetical protein
MTLLLTVYTREGIVMASDSRISLRHPVPGSNPATILAFPMSDANYKTFVSPGGIGISACGDASVEGTPIAGYIESFIREKLADNDMKVGEVVRLILEYFRALPGPPAPAFLVAGYDTVDGKRVQRIYTVVVASNTSARVNTDGVYSVYMNGEFDVVDRILNPVAKKNANGLYTDQHFHVIHWNYFTLQDAIDFCVYGVRTTIDTMKFQAREKSVGGPIDVLVIKPEAAFWVQRKDLKVVE